MMDMIVPTARTAILPQTHGSDSMGHRSDHRSFAERHVVGKMRAPRER
jgi:hypothetical protein